MASMLVDDLKTRMPPRDAPMADRRFFQATANRVLSVDRQARNRLIAAMEALATLPEKDIACVIEGSVVAVCRQPDGVVVVENAVVIE
jgi:hypothetical protein